MTRGGGEETFTKLRKIITREQFSVGVLEAETTDSDVMRLKHKMEIDAWISAICHGTLNCLSRGTYQGILLKI